MKRNLLHLFVLAILLVGCRTSNSLKGMRDYPENTQGRVKSIRTASTALAAEREGREEAAKGLVTTTYFDTDGRENEETTVTPAGALLFKIVTTYDSNGQKVQVSYDPRGELIERKLFATDEGGRLREWSRYKREGTLHSRATFAYDGQNRVLERQIFNAKNALAEHVGFAYDERGLKIEETSFYADGSIDCRRVYKYDEKGRAVEMTLFNTKGEWLRREKYDYENDDRNNWTKRTTSQLLNVADKREFEPTEITSRTLTYF